MTVSIASNPNIDQRLRQLRRANAKLIELELYNYRWSREMLARALENLNLVADSTVLSPPPNEARVQTSRYLADIVAKRAAELLEERRYTVAVLQETARRLDAIEYMVRRLKVDAPRKAEAIERIYFQGEAEEEVRKVLNVTDRTIRRWKREAVEIVADRLGLLV